MVVMESKAADVFAFGMFAVEVFTNKIPFEEQKNEAVVLRISRGGRPEMPEDAHAIGLTNEMWKLLESCWQQNPKKRPVMEEVVRRWQKFVANSDDTGCVIITLATRTSSSVPFLTSVIDPGVHHLGQDPRRGLADNGRGLRPSILHRTLSLALDTERRPKSFNLERGLMSIDSERILRRFDKHRFLRSSNRKRDPGIFNRPPSPRLSNGVQSSRLARKEHGL